MSKLDTLFTVAVAITVVALTSGDCFAQGCIGCAQTPQIVQGSSFGYPSASYGDCGDPGCGTCGGRQQGDHPRMDAMRAHHDELHAYYHKIYGRNDAWPMPWNCADRQLYFQIWDPMVDQGFEEQCVLSSAHFDPQTNQLNKFGQHAVAGIMQNMPSTRKHVFVHREGDEQLNAARLAAVTDTINTFYGQQLDGPPRVSFSTRLPNTISGAQAEGINRLWFEKMPSPIIPISSGETVNSAVGGN
jgi:hypothetical protein